jgi:hypothetical protein
MKLSWGTGITLTYIVFIGAVVAIVIYMHTLDVNLVRDDYYEHELKHQIQIDKQKRSQALPEKVAFILGNESMDVSFPKIFKPYEVEGKLTIFRPSDRSLDKEMMIDCNDSLVHQIPLANLAKGVWRIKVDWEANKTTYYDEKIVMIN